MKLQAKDIILSTTILTIIAVIAWLHLEITNRSRDLSADTHESGDAAGMNTVAPARVIPEGVEKNMQAALAERQKKLALLQRAATR